MAATHQGPDPTITLSDGKPTDLDNVKDQPLSVNTELSSSPDASRDAVALGHSRDNSGQAALFGAGGDSSVPSNIYAPQPQTFYYRGYDNVAGPWDEYSQFVNPEALEIGSPGIYNENPSVMFHTGYGYSPQMPYGPYSPVTTPLPSVGVGGDPQFYSNQQFPFSGPSYYQQVGPSMPFITSPAPVSQPDLTSLVNVDRQSDGMLFEPRPGYPPQLGSFGRGNYPGNSGTLGFHDLPQGYDGYSSIGLWSDWSKPSDRQRPMTPSSPAVFPQPVGPNGSFGQNASHHQRSYGFGNSSDPYSRNYLQKSFSPGSSFGNASVSSLGMNGRSWLALDNSRRYGRGTSSLCSCNGTLDLLNEQNRGPRASKPKIQNAIDGSTNFEVSKYGAPSVKAHNELYNCADFTTDYEDAKFFVIKSYTEDNVHKSIKYGVWASTPNGNKKLDAAYNEAKEKSGSCPIFLLFSVNASAQFCGVAEMIGPVDFDRSVDYWQQDKWSGQFPVKWHIIKDVPNNQFRHILLENNDNKPVTNSRDTQEVKLEQGIEMLKIFKSYETEMSILDDFDFYEDRQKTMQERKARQQASLATAGANENRETAVISTGFIKQMSKSFAQVVRLDDNKEGATVETPGAGPDPAAVTGQADVS